MALGRNTFKKNFFGKVFSMLPFHWPPAETNAPFIPRSGQRGFLCLFNNCKRSRPYCATMYYFAICWVSVDSLITKLILKARPSGRIYRHFWLLDSAELKLKETDSENGNKFRILEGHRKDWKSFRSIRLYDKLHPVLRVKKADKLFCIFPVMEPGVFPEAVSFRFKLEYANLRDLGCRDVLPSVKCD